MSCIMGHNYIILISPAINLIAVDLAPAVNLVTVDLGPAVNLATVDLASAINLVAVIKWLVTHIAFALAGTVLEISYNRLFFQELKFMFILHWLDEECLLSKIILKRLNGLFLFCFHIFIII